MSQTPLALVGTEIGAAVDAKADLNAAAKDRLYGGIMSLVEWRVWECLTGRKKTKKLYAVEFAIHVDAEFFVFSNEPYYSLVPNWVVTLLRLNIVFGLSPL